MPYREPDPNQPAYWRKPHDTYDTESPPEPTDQARIGWLIFVIGWSSSELARRLDVSNESARSWISGKRGVPETVVNWLEDLAKYHQQHKQPVGWGDHAR